MMASLSAQAFLERYEQVKSIEQRKNELIEVAKPLHCFFWLRCSDINSIK